eukprot:1259832-Pyramimonas_sp.AAC.1
MAAATSFDSLDTSSSDRRSASRMLTAASAAAYMSSAAAWGARATQSPDAASMRLRAASRTPESKCIPTRPSPSSSAALSSKEATRK